MRKVPRVSRFNKRMCKAVGGYIGKGFWVRRTQLNQCITFSWEAKNGDSWVEL
jgi:hypothetical protein